MNYRPCFALLFSLRPLMLLSLFLSCGRLQAVGTFTALQDTRPGAPNAGLAPGPAGLIMLLTDGRVMVSNPTTSAAWYLLTPDSQGHYVNGTWSTLASMSETRRFVSSVVMRDGRVFIAGGEYGSNGTRPQPGGPVNGEYVATAEIYTPGTGTTGTWSTLPAVPASWSTPTYAFAFGDSSAVLMPNDRILIGPVYGNGNNCAIYDIINNVWIDGPAYQPGTNQNEASWVKLKDGSILTIDSRATTSQRYVPGTPPNNGSWVADVSLPQNIYDIPSAEIGAGMLLPSGQALFLGGNGQIAIYTPATLMTAASWRMGAPMPNVLDTTNPPPLGEDENAFGIAGAADAPAVVLSNGKVLCALGRAPHSYVDSSVNPPKTVTRVFSSTTYLYEYDPVADSWSSVITSNPKPLWQTCMLDLPDGTVLFSDTTNQLYSFQADGTPLTAAKPVVTGISKIADGSYRLVGTGFTGINQGASYGDDMQMDTNYPIVKLTTLDETVISYGRSSNWSTTNVMTKDLLVGTDFTLPTGMRNEPYALAVVANGVASDNVFFFPQAPPPVVTITSPTHNGLVNAFSLSGTASDVGGAGIAGNVVNLTLFDADQGEYWDGTGHWTATQSSLSVAVVNGQWQWTGAVPSAGNGTLRSGQYALSASTRDLYDISSVPQTGVNSILFRVDLSPPTVSITTPAHGTTVASIPSVSGLAGDSNGISTVRLYLYRYSDGKFWDGSSWGGGGSAILPTSSGGGTWSSLGGVLPVPGPISNIHLTNGTYDIIAFAVDSAGNQTRADSVVTVDYHPVYTWTGSANNDWDNEQNWLSSGTVLVGPPDYDAVTGFSPSANNSTQRWQYGYTATSGTGFSNLSNPGTHTSGHSDGGTVPVWNEPAIGDMGIVFNSTDHVFHYNSGTYQPMDELGMFPNSDGRKAVVRWTAPTAGQYNFIGWFVGIESAGGGTTSDATIVLNASTNSPQPLLFHAGDASDVNYVNGYRAKKTFSFNLTLSAGATLDFRVGLGSNNNYSYDGTGLKAIIIPGAPIVESQLSGVPDANAVAIINAGSPTIPAGAQRQVYKLVMNGGVFTQGELTALKKFEWTGGQIWGTINVASQAALEINGANPKYVIAYGLYGYGNVHAPGILNNAGTATWTGTGDIQMQWRTGNGGSLNNSGTFHIQTDADMTNYNGGAFVNTGSVDKAASSDATRLDVVVTNGGTMRADTGRVVFAGGGGVSTGEFQLTSVNCLEWAGGTHTLGTGARFTGAGRARISAGIVQGATDTPAGPAVVDFAPDAELELATGGTLQRLLSFTGGGLWRWTGGQVWGTLDVTSDMRMAVAGSDPKYLIAYNFYAYNQADGRGMINLAGTATWEGSGEMNLQWGAKIVNTGSLTITSDADMTNYNGGSFVNQGLLHKAGSGGDTVFNGVVFSSPGGTLDVQTGVVSLASHGSHSFDTGTQLTGAGRTRIDSATLTVNGAIGGTGHIELAPSSALGGTHEFTGATFHWTGGSIIGTTTVGPAATLDISGTEAKVLQGYNLYSYGNPALPGILINKGTGVWTGTGEVNIQWAQNSGVIEGSTFRNEGTMSIQTDADMTVYNGGRFVNTGTLTKELSGDVTRFDVSCSNNGTVYAKSGKLQINGGGSSSGEVGSTCETTSEIR